MIISCCATLCRRIPSLLKSVLHTNIELVACLGYMYICGGSNTVVDGVGETLTQLVAEHCGVSLDAARNIKVEWKESRRLCSEHFAG